MGLFKSQPAVEELYISAGASFEGNINTEHNARIDGEVFGNITALKGTVSSGKGSIIHGDIYAKDTCLGGIVKGNIIATGEFGAVDGAEITGDVTCSAIAVDGGVYYKGMVTVTPSAGKPVPEEQPSDSNRPEPEES